MLPALKNTQINSSLLALKSIGQHFMPLLRHVGLESCLLNTRIDIIIIPSNKINDSN